MKLLLITQVIDTNDPVLGFMHRWVKEFAGHFDHISVICLKKGSYNLPENVDVFSLGKEEGVSRVVYIKRFYKYLFALRNKTDGVFVHMNAEYVILGGLFWRLYMKKIVLWYNHGQKSARLSFAMMLANSVCHTSMYSASGGHAKSKKMPVGIDTDVFSHKGFSPRAHTGNRSVLSLGRIAPVKKVDVIVEAVRVLLSKGKLVTLTVVGDALSKDSVYMNSLRKTGRTGISFQGAESNRTKVASFFNKNEFLINASPAGMFDKTVFEAMACGCIPLVSSLAFKELLPSECFFKEGDSSDLIKKFEYMLSLSPDVLEKMGLSFRDIVMREHSLEKLGGMIKELYV